MSSKMSKVEAEKNAEKNVRCCMYMTKNACWKGQIF